MLSLRTVAGCIATAGLFVIGGIVLLSACSQELPPRSAVELMADPAVREAVLLRCSQLQQAALRDEECRNVREAVDRLAAEEQEALATGEPLRRRREPRPWAHRRHIDFSDVPEERLPGLVKADPAWLRACAWMRTNRTKGLQRDEEAKQVKAKGRSVQHLVGRTGW